MRLRRLPDLLIAGLAGAYVLALPLAIGRADESHLLFEARRVFDGQAPYRDFFESLTPLSFYLFAAVFALGGTTLLAARVVIAVIIALGACLLWHLTRRIAGALEAALAVVLFIFVAVPTWPYASPHWISTTLALAVAAVTLSRRWQGSARVRPFLAGVLAGAAVCTQQQRGVFLALWLPLALLILDTAQAPIGRWRSAATAIAYGAAGGALIVVGVLGHAAWQASPATLVEMLIGFAVSHYGPTHSGHNPWAVVLPLTQAYANATWVWLLRIAPLFVAAEGTVLLLRVRRSWPRVERERAALCLLASLMAASVWYLPDIIHVSFVLPFMLIAGAAVLHRLRGVSILHRSALGRTATAAVLLLCAAAAIEKGLATRLAWRSAAPARLQTAYGEIAVDNSLPPLFAAIRQHLVPEPDGRTVFYSYPNDAWLYLTLPADNPTPFSVIVPGMFPDAHFEQVAEVLRARRPGTVLMFQLLLDNPQADAVKRAVDAGYDQAAEVGLYRIFVRRGSR